MNILGRVGPLGRALHPILVTSGQEFLSLLTTVGIHVSNVRLNTCFIWL